MSRATQSVVIGTGRTRELVRNAVSNFTLHLLSQDLHFNIPKKSVCTKSLRSTALKTIHQDNLLDRNQRRPFQIEKSHERK